MTTNPSSTLPETLGDFTADVRILPISLMAIGIGMMSSGIAWILLKLINLFTNLFYYQRFTSTAASPAGNTLGWLAVLVPVIGGLIIGLIARYGSDRIRGHGIPEAIEAILLRGSRVEPRVALLKPVSAAISIGSGGPFGAEGPIIMTGGAFGSMIAQFFRLTSTERKTLLVAGAAAGMAATFAAPVASVVLAVELLLFEWKPRSAVPVALASAAAGFARVWFLGFGPIFPMPAHSQNLSMLALGGCLVSGLISAGFSVVLTSAVYRTEDLFHRLPVHWMWWPAIGGLFVGLGGLIYPGALGVGYDVIHSLLLGNNAWSLVLGVLLVKSVIWTLSLGSGTSGGVLAPLLMMGAALGGIEAGFLPAEGLGFWPLVSMGAIFGGTMRVPLTGIIFSLELTHDLNMLLPLLISCFSAHAVAVLLLKRSILTEKVARRGYHLSREYAVDPLEIMSAREVMRTHIVALPAAAPLSDVARLQADAHHGQLLYPVIDDARRLIGVITRRRLHELQEHDDPAASLGSYAEPPRCVAYPKEPLRAVAHRMAEAGLTRLPVIESGPDPKLLGLIGLQDLLRARTRNLNEERLRERVLRFRVPRLGTRNGARNPA